MLRATTSEFESDGGDEMAAIAWSYAAALASMRLGRQTEATAILEKIQGSVSVGPWQDLVAQCLLGRLPADKLLARARTDGERTEAHTYIGVLNAILGHREDALGHLRWVKERGLKNYVEYRMATADLDRLEAPPKTTR